MRMIIAALAALFLAPPITAQVVVPLLRPVACSPVQTTQAPADGDKGPAVGGRAYQRYRVAVPIAVLASFDQVSRLTSAPSDASDVAADPLYGDTRLTLTMAGYGSRLMRPAASLTTAVNATGQLIRFWTKPITGVDPRLGITRSASIPKGHPRRRGKLPCLQCGLADPGGAEGRRAAVGQLHHPGIRIHGDGHWGQSFGADLGHGGGGADSASSTVIALGNVELVANALTKAKIIIGFDDQYPATIAYASRSMARYGFRGMLYLSPPSMQGARAGFPSRRSRICTTIWDGKLPARPTPRRQPPARAVSTS